MEKTTDKKQDYELFHKNSKSLTAIPGQDNFTYRQIFKFITHNVLDKLNNRSVKVLDVGCGVGSISTYLADKGYEVMGIDVSENAIKACLKAKENLGIKNAQFKISDILNFNSKQKFDLIILNEVIEHIESDSKALQKIYRLLRDKGFLLLTTPSINAPLYKLRLLEAFDKKVGHLRRYSQEKLEKLIKKEGFRIETIEKKEGVLRNFLYVFSIGSLPLKVIHKIKLLGDITTVLDNFLINLFGESNYFVLAQKR